MSPGSKVVLLPPSSSARSPSRPKRFLPLQEAPPFQAVLPPLQVALLVTSSSFRPIQLLVTSSSSFRPQSQGWCKTLLPPLYSPNPVRYVDKGCFPFKGELKNIKHGGPMIWEHHGLLLLAFLPKEGERKQKARFFAITLTNIIPSISIRTAAVDR
jgi:hypothetical protein